MVWYWWTVLFIAVLVLAVYIAHIIAHDPDLNNHHYKQDELDKEQ